MILRFLASGNNQPDEDEFYPDCIDSERNFLIGLYKNAYNNSFIYDEQISRWKVGNHVLADNFHLVRAQAICEVLAERRESWRSEDEDFYPRLSLIYGELYIPDKFGYKFVVNNNIPAGEGSKVCKNFTDQLELEFQKNLNQIEIEEKN